MNLNAKILLTSALLLGPLSEAAYIQVNGEWKHKDGTPVDAYPTDRLPVILLAMNHASSLAEEGDIGQALEEWLTISKANAGTEAEAVALLERGKLFVLRGEFESAGEIVDDLNQRHSNFSNFGEVVQLQFDISNRLAGGERRRLGGWFPWFKDRQSAIAIWEKTIRLAPNGPLADECLIRIARLGAELEVPSKTFEALERLVSDFPNSKYTPEALEMLADLRAKESLGPDWDQATTLEAADHLRTLIEQFPNDPRAKTAVAQLALLRDRAARARLNLARFYFFDRNNPEAAKLMANACRNLAPESNAAKEAEALLASIEIDPNPPKKFADRLLGSFPRPRPLSEVKPQPVGDDLDTLGFKKEAPKAIRGLDDK